MKYFKNVETLEQLRKQYRDLLKKYHPDNGGSEETTKEINNEYEQLFKVLKNRHSNESKSANESNSNESTCYNFEEDEKLREMLQKVIHFSDITIEIIGDWIWISGNTYQYRKDFKTLGFKFAGKKKMWYWHSESYIKKSRKTLSMDDIRNYYGSTEVETNKKLRIAQS